MSDFVTIATFDNYLSANFELQKLEEKGITCYLADENTVTIQWTLSNAMGGIKLRVLADDVEKARQILSEKPEELIVDHTIEDSDLICPNCGSNNTVEEKYSKPIFGLSLLILGFPINVKPNKSCRCFYCGHVWKM
jgi:hypothetical protein